MAKDIDALAGPQHGTPSSVDPTKPRLSYAAGGRGAVRVITRETSWEASTRIALKVRYDDRAKGNGYRYPP